MTDSFTIAVFEGDGIGPEIMAPTLRILEGLGAARGFSLDCKMLPAGAALYRETGESLPEASLAAARSADAILLAAMGLPSVRYPDGTEISPQIDLRMELDPLCRCAPGDGARGAGDRRSPPPARSTS